MINENGSDYLAYHNYLLKESKSGYVYRRLALYPFLRLLTGPKFLDVGCGKGIFLKYGDPRACLGLDVNPYNIAYVCKQGLRANLINCDDQFPVQEASFPSCIIDQVLEHVVDPSFLLRECHRALVPGGILVVGLPCEKGFAADSDHKVFYTYASISSLVQDYNFKCIRHFYFPFNSQAFGRWFTFNYLYVLFRKSS